MSIWTDFGFRESPYATTPVPPTEEGEHLLVGREQDLRSLSMYLGSSALHPTIEGDNGVGKTSLVAVAGYKLRQAYESGQTAQALIPMGRPFQLTASDTADSFLRKVLLEVAQTFIRHHEILRRGGHSVPDIGKIEDWLSQATFLGGGGGATVLGFGGNATKTTTINTSAGFNEAGFAATMRSWLEECFPSLAAGGFICTIDNLELLDTSRAARTLLEAMRDEVLGVPGLRWVLCGARGIVRSSASSPRLVGRLASPLELDPVPDSFTAELIERRIENYKMADDAVAPVGPSGFTHLYDVLHRNLRNALKFSEDFSFWMAQQGMASTDPDENHELLEVWLTTAADRQVSDTKLGGAAWKVFDVLVEHFRGSCSPSDHDAFGYEKPQPMRAQVRALEEAGLAESTVDETDKRRKTISVTPMGWLVFYARNGYQPLAPDAA